MSWKHPLLVRIALTLRSASSLFELLLNSWSTNIRDLLILLFHADVLGRPLDVGTLFSTLGFWPWRKVPILHGLLWHSSNVAFVHCLFLRIRTKKIQRSLAQGGQLQKTDQCRSHAEQLHLKCLIFMKATNADTQALFEAVHFA